MTDKHLITVVKNGVETRLDTLAFGIQTKGGVHGMPGMKSPAVQIPGRTGDVYHPGRRRGPGAVYLSMYVQECDEDGFVPEDAYPKFLENIDSLFSLFNTRFSQIAIREYMDPVPDFISSNISLDGMNPGLYYFTGIASAGTGLYSVAGMTEDPVYDQTYLVPEVSLDAFNYREAICEVEMSVAPELRGRYWGQLVVECKINDGSWREKTVNTINVGSTAGLYNLTALAGSTEDIEDAVLCVNGPVTSPKITDPLSGHYVQLNGVLAAGQQWVVDCRTWSSVIGTDLNFNATAGTNVTSQTVSSGPFAPSLYGISADVMPKMSFAGTGMGAETQLRVQARRRFL